MALLFPASTHTTLPPFKRGGDVVTYAHRLSFAAVVDDETRWKRGDKVRIEYNRARILETIEMVIIQAYPRKVFYHFRFIYNKRPVKMIVDEQQLAAWNDPPPPAVSMPKPKRKRKDKFSCGWGVCELSRHPDIPKRWAARNIPSGAVICIEPTPEYIAHQKFLAFLESLDKPRYTRHELCEYIRTGMERRNNVRLVA